MQFSTNGYYSVSRIDSPLNLKVMDKYIVETATTLAAPLLNQWQHVALVFDTKTTLYVDGNFVYSSVTTGVPAYKCKVSVYYIDIKFKQLRLWNITLTKDQIRLYSQM